LSVRGTRWQGSGEDYITRIFVICAPYKWYTGDKITMKEMGWACGTYGRQERCIQGFGRETEGRNHLEDLRVDGRIILKWFLEKCDGEVWTELLWCGVGSRLL